MDSEEFFVTGEKSEHLLGLRALESILHCCQRSQFLGNPARGLEARDDALGRLNIDFAVLARTGSQVGVCTPRTVVVFPIQSFLYSSSLEGPQNFKFLPAV